MLPVPTASGNMQQFYLQSSANYLRTDVHPTCGCGFVYKFTLNCKTTGLIARNQIKLSMPGDLADWSWPSFQEQSGYPFITGVYRT